MLTFVLGAFFPYQFDNLELRAELIVQGFFFFFNIWDCSAVSLKICSSEFQNGFMYASAWSLRGIIRLLLAFILIFWLGGFWIYKGYIYI